jgi:hypothetical protein
MEDERPIVLFMTELQSSKVPAEYRSLYTYLENRFADKVFLTFREIESLLGFALPDLARLQPDWWLTGEGEAAHARAWSTASRVATPNLLAQSVMFERCTA